MIRFETNNYQSRNFLKIFDKLIFNYTPRGNLKTILLKCRSVEIFSIQSRFYFNRERERKMKYLEPFESPFQIFTFSGLNPTVKKFKFTYRIYGTINHLTLTDLSLFLQTVYLINAKDIEMISDVLSIYLTCIGLVTKTTVVIYHFKDIQNLIDESKQLILHFEKEFSQFASKLRPRMKKSKIVSCFCFLSCVLSLSSALFLGPSFKAPYRIPFALWSPVEYENSFSIFLLLWLLEFFSSVFPSIVVIAADMLVVNFFSLAAGLLEELADFIKTIDTKLPIGKQNLIGAIDWHDANNLKELKKCIEIHSRIKKIIFASQKIFSIMIFAQFVISSITVCTTAYMTSLVNKNISSRNKSSKTLFIGVTT